MQIGKAKPAAGVFFDSDFSAIDSLLAVSLLYGLQAKNDCKMGVITLSRPNLAVAGLVDAVQRFYHGPPSVFSQLPPVGFRTVGPPGPTSPAFTVPLQKKKADGTMVYTNEVRSVIDTGDPNTLFRNYLEAQYDQNAFFVLAGPATDIAAALEFPGIPELIAAKIKYLVISAGSYPNGGAESRIKADLPAAQKVFREWPTPIIACGSEVGPALLFPGASIDNEFATAAPNNPVADAYRAYRSMPYDTPSSDLAAALFAGRPKEGYFKSSNPGLITVGDDGRTSFAASANGTHQYLIVDPAQKDKVLHAYVELASAKPVPPRRFRPDAAQDDKKPSDKKPEDKKPAEDPLPK